MKAMSLWKLQKDGEEYVCTFTVLKKEGERAAYLPSGML